MSDDQKYVTSKGAGRCSRWHRDPDCNILKRDSQEASDQTIEWHELDPCPYCTDMDEFSKPSSPQMKYQRVKND